MWRCCWETGGELYVAIALLLDSDKRNDGPRRVDLGRRSSITLNFSNLHPVPLLLSECTEWPDSILRKYPKL